MRRRKKNGYPYGRGKDRRNRARPARSGRTGLHGTYRVSGADRYARAFARTGIREKREYRKRLQGGGKGGLYASLLYAQHQSRNGQQSGRHLYKSAGARSRSVQGAPRRRDYQGAGRQRTCGNRRDEGGGRGRPFGRRKNGGKRKIDGARHAVRRRLSINVLMPLRR